MSRARRVSPPEGRRTYCGLAGSEGHAEMVAPAPGFEWDQGVRPRPPAPGTAVRDGSRSWTGIRERRHGVISLGPYGGRQGAPGRFAILQPAQGIAEVV